MSVLGPSIKDYKQGRNRSSGLPERPKIGFHHKINGAREAFSYSDIAVILQYDYLRCVLKCLNGHPRELYGVIGLFASRLRNPSLQQLRPRGEFVMAMDNGPILRSIPIDKPMHDRLR